MQRPSRKPSSPVGEVAAPLLVLASGSPRRAEMLGHIAAGFEIDPADTDESRHDGEDPTTYVERVAREKALAVSSRWPGAFVLGADTTVALDGDVIGKPADDDDARRILERLSDRVHEVLTAVVLVVPQRPGGPPGEPRVTVELAEVTFGELGREEIDHYVASGEPRGKAGAYAIQGAGGALVERISGDPSTVVGLPLRRTRGVLRDAGWPEEAWVRGPQP